MSRLFSHVLLCGVLQVMSSTDVLAQVKPGVIVGNHYTNGDLGFELDVAAGWTLSVKPTSLESGNTSEASDTSTNNQQNKPADKQWSIGKQVDLFVMTKKGPRELRNPGLAAEANELLGANSVTSLEYMRFMATKEDRIKSMLPIVIDGEAFEVSIGGVSYSALSVHMEFAEVGVLKQRLLVTIRNGYAVFFALAYRTDAELRELEQIVGSIKYRADRPSPATKK